MMMMKMIIIILMIIITIIWINVKKSCRNLIRVSSPLSQVFPDLKSLVASKYTPESTLKPIGHVSIFLKACKHTPFNTYTNEILFQTTLLNLRVKAGEIDALAKDIIRKMNS